MNKYWKYQKDRHLLGNIILCVFLLLTFMFYRFSFGSFGDKLLVLLFNGIGFLGMLLYWELLKRRDIQIFVFLIFIASVLSFTQTNNIRVIDYLTILRFLGITFILLSAELNQKWLMGVMATCLIMMLPTFFAPMASNIFSRTSQNYYSIILLLPNFVFNVSYWKKDTKSPLFPTIVIVLISYLSGGRGSFLTYSAFLFGAILINIGKGRKFSPRLSYRIFSSIFLIVLLLLTLNIHTDHNDIELGFLPVEALVVERAMTIPKELFDEVDDLDDFVIIGELGELETIDELNGALGEDPTGNEFEEDKEPPSLFARGFISRARLNLIRVYTTSAARNVEHIIFGYPLRESRYIVRFKENLHNSFLHMHANYGMIGTVTILTMILLSVIQLIRTKRIGWLIILAAILFRSATDKAAFPGNLDILIYYVMFRYPFSSRARVEEDPDENSILPVSDEQQKV